MTFQSHFGWSIPPRVLLLCPHYSREQTKEEKNLKHDAPRRRSHSSIPTPFPVPPRIILTVYGLDHLVDLILLCHQTRELEPKPKGVQNPREIAQPPLPRPFGNLPIAIFSPSLTRESVTTNCRYPVCLLTLIIPVNRTTTTAWYRCLTVLPGQR